MIALLQNIVDMFVCWVKTGVVDVANLLFAGLGAFWGSIVGLLPSMPGYPDVPSAVTTAVGYAYWAFDVGWLVAYLAIFGGLMAAVFVLMIPLRWLKAAS
jgi:hypothetical protein